MADLPASGARASGDKRPMPSIANEPVKRRAPYAQRACDACRRRKGRCNGAKPCDYCIGRSFNCCYSISSDDSRPVKTRQSSSKTSTNASKWTPDSSSINGLVATIQGHLDALASHVRTDATAQDQTGDAFARGSMTRPAQEPAVRNRLSASTSTATTISPSSSTTDKSLKRPKGVKYHGPTSPAYSLVAAQIQFEDRRMNVGVNRSSKLRSATCDKSDNESESDQEDEGHSEDEKSIASRRLARPSTHQSLFRSLHLFHTRETIRLVRVYHDVIGELHPICNIDALVELIRQVNSVSSGSLPGKGEGEVAVDVNDLLALNLALAIALTAEAATSSTIANTIYKQCRGYIDTKITSRSKSIKDVVVTLMLGLYYFFKCESQLAWRMCGLAGRMAMELGLHSREASQYDQESSEWQQELATLSCTLLVLDRQWSAATGYPSNFKETDFEMAKVSLAHTPYLKEMMKFTLISNKFNEPISQVARGECIEEDDIDLINFQVENWRKRALENQNYVHPGQWQSTLSGLPPPWTTLLYLRANAVRGILMRPFYLSIEGCHVAAKKVWPGLELVSDSLNILSILDSTTDIYKKQHPSFQHYVASSCALLFLIIIYTKKHGITPPESKPEYLRTVKQNFDIALKLSAAYSQSSRASRELWKRLQSVGEPLFRWGVLHEEALRDASGAGKSSTAQSADARMPRAKRHDVVGEDMGWAQQRTSKDKLSWLPGDGLSVQDMSVSNTMATSTGLGGTASMNELIEDDFGFDSLDPLILGWPMKSGGAWFSDGLF